MIKITKTPCTVAIFEDDEVLLEALRKSRAKGLKILDCFTPFPVHGIERVLGIKRSNLGIAAFVFGCFGFTVAFLLQTYVMKFDWPNNIGGKPTWPLASGCFIHHGHRDESRRYAPDRNAEHRPAG